MDIRFVLASDPQRILKRFSVGMFNEDYKPSYNVSPADGSYIITSGNPGEISLFEFGIKIGKGVSIPFVRAEGDRNEADDNAYNGSKAIFLKPEYKQLIRSQRCLVLADAFIVGFEYEEPRLVYLRNKKRPFAFAGIYVTYFDSNSGNLVNSFAIITYTANKLLQSMGYKRMPVILHQQQESRWLRNSIPIFNVLDMIEPFPTDLMNAYPVSDAIEDNNCNDLKYIQPTVRTFYTESNYNISRKKVKPQRDNSNLPGWGESVIKGNKN
jgi:putative SOS response-associated peptidase YedK